MIADRNFILIGGKLAEFLEGLETDKELGEVFQQCYVLGAPTSHQKQNGLVEMKWKHTMNM
eukprot:5518895-Ditylum_brightwellii.AAC.1